MTAFAHSPLALGQIGRRDQFAQRQNAVERRADLVREAGERGSSTRIGASRGAARTRACAAFAATSHALALRMPRQPARMPWHQPQLSADSWPDASSRARPSPDIGGRRALRAQLAQRGRPRRFRELAALGVEDQPVVVVERAGRPSSACSRRCTLVA